MYYVYALKNVNHNWIYVGISNDVLKRLARHNAGYNRSTKPYRPFILIYHESFPDRTSARKKEVFLKSRSGKKFLRSILTK